MDSYHRRWLDRLESARSQKESEMAIRRLRSGGLDLAAELSARLEDDVRFADALGAITADWVEEGLRDADRRSPLARRRLARACGLKGDLRALPFIAKLAVSPEHADREVALVALVDISDPTAAATTLRGALADPCPDVRVTAIEGIEELELEAEEELAKILRDDRDRDVLAAAARAVGRLGHRGSAARLAELSAVDDERLRAAALRSLATLDGDGATPLIARSLSSVDPRAVHLGIECAVLSESAGLSEPLLEVMRDPASATRIHPRSATLNVLAANAVQKLGDRSARAAAVEWIRDRHPHGSPDT